MYTQKFLYFIQKMYISVFLYVQIRGGGVDILDWYTVLFVNKAPSALPVFTGTLYLEL